MPDLTAWHLKKPVKSSFFSFARGFLNNADQSPQLVLRALTFGISLAVMKRENTTPSSEQSAQLGSGSEAKNPPPSTSTLDPAATPSAPNEIGGRGGLDPTRFGDWEKNGRCIDF